MRFNDVAILWYSVKIMNCYFASLFIILLFLSGCRTENTPSQSQKISLASPVPSPLPQIGYTGCLNKITLYFAQDLPCITCFGGQDNQGEIKKAQADPVARPDRVEGMAIA